jgi:hypothetical protein
VRSCALHLQVDALEFNFCRVKFLSVKLEKHKAIAEKETVNRKQYRKEEVAGKWEEGI